MNIRVLLADDHKIMREGLRALLERTAEISIVAEAGDGAEAVRKAAETSPDVIVMDLNMPVMSGIEATRLVVAADPRVKVVGLSMVLDQESVVATLKAGAYGYVLKDCAADDLRDAIRTVVTGEYYLSSKITTMILKDYLQIVTAPMTLLPVALTPREEEILRLIAGGSNTKEIALELGLSVKTIEARRLELMKKLEIDNIAGLTKFAIREGLATVR